MTNLSARISLQMLWCCAIFLNLIFAIDLQAQSPNCQIVVDLSEVDRNIISSKLHIPVQPGKLSLWYPKWLPGCHAPAGPIQNLAHLSVKTDLGEIVPWNRRSGEPCEFLLTIPEGTTAIDVEMKYIVNQATTNSEGSDCAFEGNVGYFSFNACLVYPDTAGVDELIYDVSIALPVGIQVRSPLAIASQKENSVRFEPVSLLQLVDCPLILAENVKTYLLAEGDDVTKPHFLHVAAREASTLELPEEFVTGCQRLVREATAIFGEAPFEEYHFLVIIDDELADIGLEHMRCSLNTMSLDEMDDPDLRSDWPAELLPHEYVHAWCGKYRIPRNMAQNDFHSDKDFRLLWVYEGLTEYYGTVLATRSGLVSKDTFLQHKAQRIHELSLQMGRSWRSLEDTAVTSHLLRDFSNYWQYLRRDQDYYDEGALYWWEVDAMIRRKTDNQLSLDDFCLKFFSAHRRVEFIPYNENEIYRVLDSILPYDWKNHFAQRVKATQRSLNMRAVAKSGYKLVYRDQRSEYLKRLESEYGYIDESACLGMFIDPSGTINDIVPNGPADQAKLADGDVIILLNGDEFSPGKLREWLASVTAGATLEMDIERDTKPKKVQIKIGNPQARFPFLEATSASEVLDRILQPHAEPAGILELVP